MNRKTKRGREGEKVKERESIEIRNVQKLERIEIGNVYIVKKHPIFSIINLKIEKHEYNGVIVS